MPGYIDHTLNIPEITKDLYPDPTPGNLYKIPKNSVTINFYGSSVKAHKSMVVCLLEHDINDYYFFIHPDYGSRHKVHKSNLSSYKQKEIVFWHNGKRYKVSADIYYQSEMGKEKTFEQNKKNFVAHKGDPIFEIDDKKYYVTEWSGRNEIQIAKYEEDISESGTVYKAKRFPKKKQAVSKHDYIADTLLGNLQWKHAQEFKGEELTDEQWQEKIAQLNTMFAEVIEKYKKNPMGSYGKTRVQVS